MNVRAATEGDAERCAQISKARSAEELAALLDAPDVKWLVVEDDAGEVVGIGIVHFWPWNKAAWVWDLTVAEDARGKGHGTALLKGMIRAAREMGARVLMDFDSPRQSPLVDLYLRNGFRISTCTSGTASASAERTTGGLRVARIPRPSSTAMTYEGKQSDGDLPCHGRVHCAAHLSPRWAGQPFKAA
jgi:GNAT superfamily N-acetyltransferase